MHSPDTGTDKTRTPKRTRAGPDTKAKVVRLHARHPDLTTEDIAKRLDAPRTVHRHLGGRWPKHRCRLRLPTPARGTAARVVSRQGEPAVTEINKTHGHAPDGGHAR